MYYRFIYIIFLYIFIGSTWAQRPKYIAPVDSPLYLSGNFCQLREGHFHFGLDIPTNDTIWPVYAVSDGFISRVFSADYGYGQALFITHTDKNISVYAHLSSFRSDIAQWLNSRANQLQRNNLDLFPKKNEFPVKRGTLIGWSGSSGASTGPHLHLEIRNQANALINPAYYFDIPDTMPPVIEEVILREGTGRLVKAQDDTFHLYTKKAYINACIYDRAIFMENKLAPYQIRVSNNNGEIFKILFNQFSFSQNPSIVRHTHRTLGKIFQKKMHRLWVESGNNAPFYSGKGITTFPSGMSDIKIEARDYSGKTTSKTYFVQVQELPPTMQPCNYFPSSLVSYYNEDSSVELQVLPKPNPDSLGILWGIEEDSIYMTQGGLASIDDFIPEVHVNIRIPAKLQYISPNKLYIGYRNEEGLILYCGGLTNRKDYIHTQIKVPGVYKICVDTLPPTYTEAKLLPDGSLEISISENESGLYKYQLYLNGTWKRCLRNPISGKIIYKPEPMDKLMSGIFTLHVIDKIGNSATYSFSLKP